MGCGGPLAKRTAATPGPSTQGFRRTGHLFQGRFGAVEVDELDLLAATRYIALNPVVVGLVSPGLGRAPARTRRARMTSW